MHFTSGTSGRPKAVWSGWLSPDDADAWIHEESAAWGITADDVHLVCGPLSHSAPLRFALMTLLNGGSVIVPPAFDVKVASDLLTQATTTFMAPTHMQRIMEHHRGGALPHNLRLLAHAGAACPDHVRIWAHETFGTDIVTEFYGSTEGQFTLCTAEEWQEHPGTVGRARPGRQLRVDDQGMLWCHVPEHARFSYWGDPEKTRETWQDSWFTVHDLGHIDSDGYVYLDGRSGDLIITGGVNVYPAEIERVLSHLAGITHAVAFGLPDDTWGEKVCVAVLGDRSEDDIREYLTEQLSGPKRPKTIFIVDALPLTHSGKINRSAVRDLFT
jgi:long-chain acyl-CoA synthetase